MVDEKKPGIWKKILAASAAIKSLEKDKKTTEQGNYEYLSGEKIVAAAKKALHAQGLHAIGSVTKVEELEKGAKAFRQRTYMDVVIVDIDTEEMVTVKVTSMGVDNWDKGDGKANTYAFKYGLKRILMIESGEDELDGSSGGDNAPKDSEENREQNERQKMYDRLAVHIKALGYNSAQKLEVLNKFGGDAKNMSIKTLVEVENELKKRLAAIGKGDPDV